MSSALGKRGRGRRGREQYRERERKRGIEKEGERVREGAHAGRDPVCRQNHFSHTNVPVSELSFHTLIYTIISPSPLPSLSTSLSLSL